MRVLIDTNILIYREDYHELDARIQRLFSILEQIGAEVFIHPRTIEEINHDSDEKRKKIIDSKIGAYSQIESPPDYTEDKSYIERLGKPKNSHDDVDYSILFAVYKNAVGYLITEDKRIIKSAEKINIEDRVFRIDEAIGFYYELIIKQGRALVPSIKDEYLYNIDIDDPIFDSLKSDYPGFESWIKRKAREGRKCLVHYREKDKIGAILMLKIEEEAFGIDPPLPSKRRVKICTLKVSSTGNKIGELFLKCAIDMAILNNIDEIYLTIFPHADVKLFDLIMER